MKKPLISVIMPVYNSAKFLNETLLSVSNQSLSDFELIAVNDGSTDNSLDILSAYAKEEKRLRVISIPNSGAGQARNRGIDLATGRYICFVDSDDIPTSNYLKELYSTIKTNNACLGCVKHSEFTKKPTSEMLSSETSNIDSSAAISMLLLEKISGAPHCKIYSRNLIGKTRFKDYSIAEDLFFNYEYLKKCSHIAINSSVCYNYRLNNQGLSKKTFNKKRMDGLEAVLQIQKDAPSEESSIRLFMEAEYILEAIIKSRHDYQVEKTKCKKIIKQYRQVVLKSKLSSSRQKAIALLSCFSAALPSKLVAIKGGFKK